MSKEGLRAGEAIKAGWRLAFSDSGAFFLLGFAVLAHGVTIALGGPAMSGAALFAGRKIAGESSDLGIFYRGFSRGGAPYYASLILAAMVILPSGACLVAAAAIRALCGDILGWLLAFPFLALMVVYVLTIKVLHMYVFHELAGRPDDLWGAFERSRRLVAEKPIEHLALGAYILGLNLAGFLACCAGLLLTVPLTICTISVAHSISAGDVPGGRDVRGDAGGDAEGTGEEEGRERC